MSEPWDNSAAFVLPLAIATVSVSLPRVVPRSATATNRDRQISCGHMSEKRHEWGYPAVSLFVICFHFLS